MHYDPHCRPKRSWPKKFYDAFHGAWHGIEGQSSFVAHFLMAGAVILAGIMLHIALVEWCIVGLCITVVLGAEMFNSALERLSRAITDQHDPRVGTALNIGSAAVLVSALGAAAIGTIIFLHRLLALLSSGGA